MVCFGGDFLGVFFQGKKGTYSLAVKASILQKCNSREQGLTVKPCTQRNDVRGI
jgi:hypothetical protein